MPDDKYTFEQARIRLEEIAAEVRKKDTSLEKSLDLLEEGVRLANICTELVDHTDTSASVTVPVELSAQHDDADETGAERADGAADTEAEPVGDAAPDEEPDGFDDADDAAPEPADVDPDD